MTYFGRKPFSKLRRILDEISRYFFIENILVIIGLFFTSVLLLPAAFYYFLRPNELTNLAATGDYLGGVGQVIVLIWAAIGFYFQRRELIEQKSQIIEQNRISQQAIVFDIYQIYLIQLNNIAKDIVSDLSRKNPGLSPHSSVRELANNSGSIEFILVSPAIQDALYNQAQNTDSPLTSLVHRYRERYGDLERFINSIDIDGHLRGALLDDSPATELYVLFRILKLQPE